LSKTTQMLFKSDADGRFAKSRTRIGFLATVVTHILTLLP